MYAAQAAERVGGRPRLEPAFNDTDEQPPADLQEVPRRERESVELAGRTVSVSGRVVAQAKRVHAEAPDLAAKVQAGELAIDRAERIVRDRQAEAGRVARAREDAAQLPVRPTVDIRHGDFRDVLTDIGDVDAVITDPPYGRDYLPLLGDLAKWADQALSPDGILAVLFGQTYLPDVYQYLEGYRPYRWTMAYLTPGAGYASHTARVQSNWKPVLIYGGGPRFADVLSSTGTDAGAKDLHYWGQDYGAFHTLIERLTRPGQTVADPFCGSGTTLLAAHALGRHAIGSDIDADHVSTARERIA
jgi:site-specific DNA-methyltransferase (adenine-specific)